jgi:PAS domain S-box-containing protein
MIPLSCLSLVYLLSYSFRCAEYVKHMMKIMKQKEDANNELKSDLEVKQRKIEEDKSAQESRSDPESSVTSSLTSSTSKKRKASDSGGDSSGNSKKHRMSSKRNMSESSGNEDSSGGEERTSGEGTSAQGFSSIDKNVSSMSDMTDSNPGSSSNDSGGDSGGDSGSGSGSTERVSPTSADEEERPSTGSISSDAAVVSQKSSLDSHNGKDVIFKTENSSDRKRPSEEATSLERSFELDYEEVFDKSNIPQLIAGTSGKIVSWNDCFIKATGLRKSEVDGMTIFSLVKPNKLSNFFQIVSQALKPPDDDTTMDTSSSDENVKEESSGSEAPSSEGMPEKTCQAYSAMTLPCVDFPGMRKRRGKNAPSQHSDPLHVTVSCSRCCQTEI